LRNDTIKNSAADNHNYNKKAKFSLCHKQNQKFTLHYQAPDQILLVILIKIANISFYPFAKKRS
jgi:hypothetical protein